MTTGFKARVAASASIAFVLATAFTGADVDQPVAQVAGGDPDQAKTSTNADTAPASLKHGVLQHDARAFPGYNLINPGRKQAYLFDNEGRVVHTWTSEHSSGAAVYLLENGNLFRPAEGTNVRKEFQGPAKAGRIQEFDWDGNLVWDFEYHSNTRLPHHDAIKLPNGNALLICWEWIDENEAVAQGRRPETVKDSHLQPDCLVEIRPTGLNSGEVVWEWRSWDHLIQDQDRHKPNFGRISDHPERIDVNYIHEAEIQPRPVPANDTIAKQDSPKVDVTAQNVDQPGVTKDPSNDVPKQADPPEPRKNPDWMHINAVAYNEELDQIALSVPNFHEIWIIDHSTTTEEAKGHTGGRSGKGGDLLYRWGNPRAYGMGDSSDQRLFFQHNVHWIPKNLPGEGHLLVFNNGGGRKPEEYSSVDELVPPVDEEGHYIRPHRRPFGPDVPSWSYTAPEKKDFFSWFISGAQRLPNGNTLINAGAVGIVFEVTSEGETVWKFSNPFKPVRREPAAAPEPKRRFESISGALRDTLQLSDDQRKRLDEIDNELVAELDNVLTPAQIKSFAERNPNDTADFIKRPAGEYLTELDRSTPELAPIQRTALQKLQQEFSAKIAALLSDDQKERVAQFKKAQLAAASRRGPARKSGNTLFRASRYALDHPAFAGRSLAPGKTLVEIEEEFDKQQAREKAEADAKSATAAASS